jgi:tRNA (uracil-5-)-methyltransferase
MGVPVSQDGAKLHLPEHGHHHPHPAAIPAAHPRDRPSESEYSRVNPRFIPPSIDVPAPGEPCGLFVDGLNFHWDRERTEKLLTRAGIKWTRVNKKKSCNSAQLYFDNAEDRRAAYEALIKRETLSRTVWVVPLRRDFKVCERHCHCIRARATSADLETRTINDRVAPWSKLPYAEQIVRKSEKYTELLRPILPADAPPLKVFPAPKIRGFRNKVELTFGLDLTGNVAVGFNLGSKVEDVVQPVDDCVNVSEPVVPLAEALRAFAVETGLPVFDRIANQGTWKFVLIRTTELGQALLALCTFEPLPDEIVARFTEEFAGKVTSLWYVQSRALEGWGRDRAMHHLSGPEVIVEKLRGLEFDISPMSFFQCNTTGAELLFTKIEELAEVDAETVLIDCCCGTGVIGLAMARNVGEVIGIDIEEEAVNDAKRNAAKNGIENATFHCGKAEAVLPAVLSEKAAEGRNIVCIVDPPRDGLHKSALRAIRDCCLLRRLVYVACAPESLVRDAQRALMNDGDWTMRKFVPKVWFGVDMFPHTDKCELVMLWER